MSEYIKSNIIDSNLFKTVFLLQIQWIIIEFESVLNESKKESLKRRKLNLNSDLVE